MDSSTENLQEFIELYPPLPDAKKRKEDENMIELIDDRTEDDMFADDYHHG